MIDFFYVNEVYGENMNPYLTSDSTGELFCHTCDGIALKIFFD